MLIPLLIIGAIAAMMNLTGCSTDEADIAVLSIEKKQMQEKLSNLQYRLEEKENRIKALESEVYKLKSISDFKGGMLYIEPEYKLRFVENELEIHIIPVIDSSTLRIIEPNTVVTVNDLVEIGQERWIYVTVPVYDTPMDIKGWIRESDTVAYTQDKVSAVQSDITIIEGSPYYEVYDFKDITDSDIKKMTSDQRGRLDVRQDGYSRISAPGGWSFWVKDQYVVFPEADK